MAKMTKIKDRSGYFFIASGFSFAATAHISSQNVFYVIAAMLIVIGIVDLKISNRTNTE